MNLLLHAWFCNSFLDYIVLPCRSSLFWHISSCSIKKITFISITTNLIRKSFKSLETVMLMMADKSFHNSNFPFKVQTALFPPILPVVFLEVAGLLAKYWSTKMIFCLLVVLSNKIGALCKRYESVSLRFKQ